MTPQWIVEIEPEVWLAKWSGDPGRSVVIECAKRYPSIRSATAALAKARQHRPFRDARIVEAPL